MTYTLDTNTCITFLRGKHLRLRQRVLSHFHDIAFTVTATVVTHNTGEFSRIPGLLVEDRHN